MFASPFKIKKSTNSLYQVFGYFYKCFIFPAWWINTINGCDNMVRIINSANETLAILQNVVSPLISEELNREFTFTFSTIVDNDKSNYVNYQNKVEVEDNYFNIVYTEEERTAEGLFIRAQCEHVSYDLLSANFTAGFTATGLFSAVATTILAGTGFTVGTVASTAAQTISVLEATNARQLMISWAALHGGELEWDKYQVNEMDQRGANRGVQFRYRKNLVGVKRITDNRKKVAGLPTISYQASAAELEYEQEFINSGVNALEHYELGDTVRVIDDDLGLDLALRIVKESHDTEQRMQGQVEIANFVDDLTDTLTQIQTTSVSKDKLYNGCSIGPDLGFVAERSDGIAITEMNATEGITVSLRASITASYSAVFYVHVDTAAGTANLYLAGGAVFQGVVNIGSGSNVFVADGNSGIWLGSSAFSTAPFKVSLAGLAEATGLTVISGSITGSVIQTGITGARVSMYDGQMTFYDAYGNATMEFPKVTSANLTKRINFFSGGNPWGGIQTYAAGDALEYTGPPVTGGTTALIQLTDTGAINFAGNATSGLGTNTEPDHAHTFSIGTANYTTNTAGSHSHLVNSI
jgi:hypothetical protein